MIGMRGKVKICAFDDLRRILASTRLLSLDNNDDNGDEDDKACEDAKTAAEIRC